MTKQNLSNLIFAILIILLIIAGVVSWNLFFKTYLQEDTVNIHAFPRQIGPWSSEEIPIDEHSYQILETRNAFVRRYFTPQGQEVQLFIVYSQNNRKVSHPPELCYTGSGATVLKKQAVSIPLNKTPGQPLDSLQVQQLKLELRQQDQVLVYWFKVGDTFTASYLKQQILIAVKNLLGQPASSALIRVSADVKGQDIESARQDIRAFVKEALPSVVEYIK